MDAREMEHSMSESIPDLAHFFHSHSSYQQLHYANRTCSSLSESIPTYAKLATVGPFRLMLIEIIMHPLVITT